jgi:hypothetical protein
MNAPAPSSAEQIALSEVAPTLSQLWRDSADAEHPVTHVRTLNLVIFVPADQHNAALQRTIDELAVQHPGRTIALIVHNEPHPSYAQASLACRLGGGDKHICGEQITLHGGDGGAPLFSTMASLLLPDLPVFVWWLGDPPFNSPLFDNITELADRVLVDARTWRSSDATLHGVRRASWNKHRCSLARICCGQRSPRGGTALRSASICRQASSTCHTSNKSQSRTGRTLMIELRHS